MTAPPYVPLVAQAMPDTLVMVQARSTLEAASDVAVIVLALALAGAAVWMILFLRRLSSLERTIRAGGQRLAERTAPLVDRGKDVADNLEFVTRAVRGDVERLNRSVKALAERLQQASDRMEERIEEFNALMEVVQSEAEAIFVDTASTVRGVREGARSLGGAEAGGGVLGTGDATTTDPGGPVEDPERRKEA